MKDDSTEQTMASIEALLIADKVSVRLALDAAYECGKLDGKLEMLRADEAFVADLTRGVASINDYADTMMKLRAARATRGTLGPRSRCVRQAAKARIMSDENVIRVVHVIGPLGEGVCPKCGSLHEDEGGEVSERGSWDEGPFFWQCGKCGEQWGHA